MKITILTLFPEYFKSILDSSIIKKAQEKGLVSFNVINIRDFADLPHKLTDDRPFGGGSGMVMMVKPIDSALQSIGVFRNKKIDVEIDEKKNEQVDKQLSAKKDTQLNVELNNIMKTKIVLTSAKGKKFDQLVAKEYAKLDELVLICGHYEGVDERVAQNLVDEEVRIGNYVLTGGEPAVGVILDSVTRLIPGVLGNEESNLNESHEVPGKLGYPVYSRPANYKGWEVPMVLLSGNHQKIKEWRSKQEKNDQ